MRREPSSSLLKTSSSSQGSICNRRRGFPVENIPGAAGAGRWRKRPVGRNCLRSYRSYSCYRNCRNRSCRRRCNCRNRENRGSDSYASRYSNSLELVDNWNWGLADRRLLAGRRLGPSWRRQRDPGSDQARHLAESGPCCLGRICYTLRRRKIERRMRVPELEQVSFY